MAVFDDVLKGGSGTSLAVAGAAILAPTLFPAVARMLRPVAKAAIKGGLVLYRETVAGVGGVAGALIEEARAELDESTARSVAKLASSAKSLVNEAVTRAPLAMVTGPNQV
jgi:hypothetical protein